MKALLEAASFLATKYEVISSDRRLNDRIINLFLNYLEEACNSLDIGSEGYEPYSAGGVDIPYDETLQSRHRTWPSPQARRRLYTHPHRSAREPCGVLMA